VQYWPWQAALLACTLIIFVYQALTVTSESITVLQDVGIILKTTRSCGWTQSTFIDLEKIRAVIINEAVTAVDVKMYLAFVLYNGSEMAVAFPNLLPRLAVLQPMYREISRMIQRPVTLQ